MHNKNKSVVQTATVDRLCLSVHDTSSGFILPKAGTKEYRLQRYHNGKDGRKKNKVSIINCMKYQRYRLTNYDNNPTYISFVCACCLKSKEAIFFYEQQIQYSRTTRKRLACKVCVNSHIPFPKKNNRAYKVRHEEIATPEMREFFRAQKALVRSVKYDNEPIKAQEPTLNPYFNYKSWQKWVPVPLIPTETQLEEDLRNVDWNK